MAAFNITPTTLSQAQHPKSKAKLSKAQRKKRKISKRTSTLKAAAPRKAIVDVPQVKRRIERGALVHSITSNGTIAAAAMVAAALLAVIVANSPAWESVHHALNAPLEIVIGSFSAHISVEEFVNDFLMAIFFLLVGIELKYEMTVGELQRPRQAALPMLAAVGGVCVPALIYAVMNAGGAIDGWAIPIATDIAFALGVMSLLGKSIAPETKVFFQTLAIADDILAIVVIALFYGQTPDIAWVGASLLTILVLWFLLHRKIYSARPYLVVGFILWICMYNSGIHATLAGVILAFFLPVRSDVHLSSLTEWLGSRAEVLDEHYEDDCHVLGQHHFISEAGEIERVMHHVTPPLQRVEHAIAMPVNFIILPIFAFVNAQVRLVGADFGAILTNHITQGAFFGAVLGKPIGIIGVTLLLVKLGIFKLPRNVDARQVIAVGLMGGLGFTMSILISGLAFSDTVEVTAAKCAILAGSIAASLLGLLFIKLGDMKDSFKEFMAQTEDEPNA